MKRFKEGGGHVAAVALLLLLVLLFYPYGQRLSHAQTNPEANLKVAFVGDDAIGENNKSVLRLIKNEGAAFVVDGGDLDYKNNPTLWEKHLTSILGPTYPYFVAMGNHDEAQWPGYAKNIKKRLDQVKGADCKGDVGRMQTCTYKGIFMVIVAPGLSGGGDADFIKRQLASSNATWKICSWHVNMKEAQIGSFPEKWTSGWDVYEACRKGGAIIATAHVHSYSRTKTLIDVAKQIVDPKCPFPNLVCVALGRTFLFVSGLGGKSINPQTRCFPSKYPYGCKEEWAKIYTTKQNATFGALFIIFNYNGDPNKAHGYFKNIDGDIVDEFDIRAGEDPTPTPTLTPSPTPAHPTFYCLGLGTDKCQK